MIRKNVEYEKRGTITEKDYHVILSSLKNISRRESIIYNIYYDLEKTTLIPQGYLFRLRNINNTKYEFTLKISRLGGDLEENLDINEDTYLRYCTYNYITVPNELRVQIKHIDIPNNLLYKKCTLQTKRLEFEISDYTLVLDENSYNGITDYDIEVEAKSMKRANEVFKDILKTYFIKKTRSHGKSSRAIATIK